MRWRKLRASDLLVFAGAWFRQQDPDGVNAERGAEREAEQR